MPKTFEIRIPVSYVQVFRVRAGSEAEALRKYEDNSVDLVQMPDEDGTTDSGGVEIKEIKRKHNGDGE